MSMISRDAAIQEIHKYFMSELDKEETHIQDGWEVYANIPHVTELLTHNKQISIKIKSLPTAEKVGKWVNDLISRRAAIKAIDDLPNCYNGYSDTYDKAYIIGVLEELPTIDVPERKVGKWIKDGVAYSLYKCSACNDFCTVAGWANCIPEEQMYKGFKFCPNCGALMREDGGEG